MTIRSSKTSYLSRLIKSIQSKQQNNSKTSYTCYFLFSNVLNYPKVFSEAYRVCCLEYDLFQWITPTDRNLCMFYRKNILKLCTFLLSRSKGEKWERIFCQYKFNEAIETAQSGLFQVAKEKQNVFVVDVTFLEHSTVIAVHICVTRLNTFISSRYFS